MTSDRPAPRDPASSRGAGEARAAILRSASEEFARAGYGGATVRGIAAGAGVDPALVMHYFRNKESLFAATLSRADGVFERVVAVLDGPRDAFGERMARTYLGLWEAPDTAPVLASIVRSALTTPVAAGVVRALLEASVIGADVSPWPRERLNLAGSQLFGIAVARYLIGTEPLASMSLDDVVTAVGPQLQALLEGSFDGPKDSR